jgi:hypothetical protein
MSRHGGFRIFPGFVLESHVTTVSQSLLARNPLVVRRDTAKTIIIVQPREHPKS